MTTIHDKERSLTREVTRKIEAAIPGTEVLAVELGGRERFTVFVDHPGGVDHSLCARVTDALREYLRDYRVDVSSPGVERPLRTPAHFVRAVGHTVQVRTETDIDGRKRFKGELKTAGTSALTVGVDGADYVIPYDVIVRGNVIDEG